jgi:Ribosome biogenesis protein, C-terminal
VYLTEYITPAYKLTCLEAIAASLYLTSHDELADELLSKFSWGHSFFELNGCFPSFCPCLDTMTRETETWDRHLLDRYKTCQGPEEVLRVQEEMIEGMLAQARRRRESSSLFFPPMSHCDSFRVKAKDIAQEKHTRMMICFMKTQTTPGGFGVEL